MASISTLQALVFFAGPMIVTFVTIILLLKTPIALYFVDKPDPRKVHRNPIPRFGGVVIVASVMLFAAVALLLNSRAGLFSGNALSVLYAMLFAAAIILVTGFFDDTTFVNVRVRHKLLAEFVMAFVTVAVFKINIGTLTLFGSVQLPMWLGSALSFLWIIGLANAYNLIDGLDGLAGSVSLVSILTVAVLAAVTGVHVPVLLVLALIIAGSVTGFLCHNLPPAKTFMGDTGSIFLGTVVAILTLYIGREAVPAKAVVVLPLIAGVPILEVFVSMVRRYFKTRDRKKSHAECLHSMVIPDNSHIHHRLLYRGYSTKQAVLLIALLSFTLCCGALCITLLPVATMPFLLAYLAVPVYFTLYQLGFGGRFRKALRLSPTRYNGFWKSSLIGVIDSEGSFTEKLEKKMVQGVSCIKIQESDIPALHQHLRAAVVRDSVDNPHMVMKKAEEMSYLLRGPVYLVEGSNTAELFVREVSKNGSLLVNEKRTSIDQLLKDLKRLNTTERLRHSRTMGVVNKPEPVHVC